MKTVLHTTTGLHTGGAETMLAKLIEADLELHPEQRRQLGQAARARTISLFSLNCVAQQCEALYERVLSTHARSREADGCSRATQGRTG